jgi:hypothetical protein
MMGLHLYRAPYAGMAQEERICLCISIISLSYVCLLTFPSHCPILEGSLDILPAHASLCL